jgi:hypothetical protein
LTGIVPTSADSGAGGIEEMVTVLAMMACLWALFSV